MKQGLLHMIVAMVSLLPAVIYSGCSGVDDPTNLEPTITLLEATDITRNEVTLSAEIINHGTGKLSSVVFMYAPENESTFKSTQSLDKVEGIVSIKLTGLSAGRTYSFFAQGTAGKATVTTSKGSFTTVPNDLPTVNEAQILSTGPTGVIIQFDIPEDGGEQLLSAGCNVLNNTTGESMSFAIEGENLRPGFHKLSITGLTPNSTYILTTFASNALGIITGDGVKYITTDAVMLNESGELQHLFGYKPICFPSISIAGPMNGTDFRFLRQSLGASDIQDMPMSQTVLTRLDLTGVDIIEGGASFDGSRFTHTDTIETGLFAGCSSLKELILPSSAKAMLQDALRDCTGLSSFTVPAGMISVKPSSGCLALERIDVSEANDHYSCYDGVLFNNDVTSIIWFPRGKKGNFSLPSTISCISTNAFSETSITTLSIPSSVTIIERGAFAGSMLEEITLPDNLRNLAAGTFQNCVHLKQINIGNGLEFFGDYALDGSRVEHLYISAQIPPYASTYALTCRDYDLTKSCTLHVPAASRDRYRLHNQWGKFSKIIGF